MQGSSFRSLMGLMIALFYADILKADELGGLTRLIRLLLLALRNSHVKYSSFAFGKNFSM